MKYDIIVVGGGHAGIEAATAAFRMGSKVALVTMKRENIGMMSCNPSIGGIGKGTIVKEIDALDGVMGIIADQSAIGFRILNRSKGPAVWGWRAQIDRDLYKHFAYEILTKEYSGIDILLDKVEEIKVSNSTIQGVVLKSAGLISAKSIVITTGTFLGAQMHAGANITKGGRINESAANNLVASLEDLGLSLERLKTGTPPRLYKNTINFSALQEQLPDEVPLPFSDLTTSIAKEQISCYITRTNTKSHEIITNNSNQSPILNGAINVKGPRYCPSFEDKIRRFRDKDSHLVFLEPEGFNSNIVYPNGISISMPPTIQQQFINTIEGLEKAEIQQFGYLVEYAYLNPMNLKPTLETKKIQGLFLAGQINGTTGYEEAAGQGVVAGINAALKSQGNQEFILNRCNSYIGVMIDDLTTSGVDGEPYRMFTSRSEYRLMLRGDNAISRLTANGIAIGCVRQQRSSFLKEYERSKHSFLSLLQNLTITSKNLERMNFKQCITGQKYSAESLLSRGFEIDSLVKIWPDLQANLSKYSNNVISESIADCKYKHYITKQKKEVEKLQSISNCKLSSDLDYSQINSLSSEEVEKLQKHKPTNLNAALKIPGVTPAAITAIMYHISSNTPKAKTPQQNQNI